MSKQSFKIKDIFADHWDNFLALDYPIRPEVIKNVNKIINCKEPSMGHALYYCDECHHFIHVPFTCKSRFCNTCGGKYVEDRARAISSKLIHCAHRHIVFTIPKELRRFFRKDRSLLHLLFNASASTIHSWFNKLNKAENFTPGFVSTLHTFGRDLKWNPHIHLLVTEGAAGNKTRWRKIKHIPFDMLRKRWQATLLNLLHKHLGHSFYELKSTLFKSYKDGFYVHAPSKMDSSSVDAIKYIIRYTGRPAMAQSRILDYDGEYVTYYYEPHNSKERIVEKIHAFDLIKKLIIHIPDEQFKMIRYYGLYAKKHKHSKNLYLLLSKSARIFHERYKDWRSRLILSFNKDPLKCSCGNTMTYVDIFIPTNNPYLDKPPPLVYNSL